MSERPKDVYGIDRSQPLPAVSGEALARHREEVRTVGKRVLDDYNRWQWVRAAIETKLGGTQ